MPRTGRAVWPARVRLRAEPSAEVARYLTEHFTTRVSRWRGDDREPPNRLVYLLDPVLSCWKWPPARARRNHVKDRISSAELPVKHEIWKFGSPHTLVLTKTDELFRREAKACKDATASLEWLTAQRRR